MRYTLYDLAIVDRQVAEGERLISELKDSIREAARAGQPTDGATRSLASMLQSHARTVERRDRIGRVLRGQEDDSSS